MQDPHHFLVRPDRWRGGHTTSIRSPRPRVRTIVSSPAEQLPCSLEWPRGCLAPAHTFARCPNGSQVSSHGETARTCGRGVIRQPGFVVEPWAVRETAVDLEYLAQTESVFALSNGHLGLRANLDEGEPFGLPGTYLAGFYETRPLPYAEAGYGDPEDGQTVVNVTNGKLIRLLVEDEPFDVRYGELRTHERVLDFRVGVLRRTAEWRSPTGRRVRVSSTRMVSFTQRSIAAILYEVEPLDGAVQIVVQSELVANETLPVTERDPRAAAALASPLASDFFYCEGMHAVLVHTTRSSGLTVGVAMDHRIEGPPDMETTITSDSDLARLAITATAAPGTPLRLTKFLSYSWSGKRTVPAGLRGAAFPWRTIAGQECSGYWPAGTAAFHVNAAIANAVNRYQLITEDEAFEREAGVELLVETARLWCSLGHYDTGGRFRIDGVTGPDEYSALADNNVYTNLMAARNLRAAAEAVDRHPDLAKTLGVEEEETTSWRDAAEAMFIPYDESLGVHPQAEGFTQHEVWDFDSTPAENYPLLMRYPYVDLYRKQVVKQADLVMALFFAGEAFPGEQKARDFAYYEKLTVRDSSLSACIQAVVAAEVGHVELAYDYFAEATLLDLDDLEHNTRDGVHIASLSGACITVMAGFGGLRDHVGMLTFTPRLPQGLSRLAFSVRRKNARLRIEAEPTQATYTLPMGDALDIHHHGRPVTVTAEHPVQCPIPPAPALEQPTQPRGREPARRGDRSRD